MTDKTFTVRQSDIDGLLAKVAERKLQKYLLQLSFQKLRGFHDQQISFDFPVTALIGVNGGGKTTVLGAAGLAYFSVQPKTFFARGGTYDPAMRDWKIQFEYFDRPNFPQRQTSTATYKTSKWDRKKLNRDVLVFGVSRTVPANERKELRKCSSTTFQVESSRITELTDTVKEHAGRILGKSLEGFRGMQIDDKGDIKFLAGQTEEGHSYSEFHFGAGESSVIRIVSEIELANDYSLVLIEEIENGLHPVATRKLVEYLIEAAKRKNIQAIFTTHSNFAISQLPHKAIWTVSNGIIRQGKLEIESLRALTGSIDSDAAIFVEDQFAKTLVEAILRQHSPDTLARAEIHPMQGDGIARNTTLEHRRNPAVTKQALCVLDGDSDQEDDVDNGILRLPGNAPEIEIFGKVLEAWPTTGGRLTVALNQPPEKQNWVREILKNVQREVGDHHLYFARAAEQLMFLPTSTVEQAFCNIYAQSERKECGELANQIVKFIDV